MRTESAAFGPGAASAAPWPDVAPRTAVRLEDGEARHALAHRARLEAALEALGHESAWLAEALEQAWRWTRREAAPGPMALRLSVDPGDRRLSARLEPLPPTPEPYVLVPRLHPFALGRGERLAPHKGCRGPWTAELLEDARRSGGHDALLHWPDGTLAETAIAALGVQEGRRLRLPPFQGRVRSVAELLELPAWADERGWELTHGPVSLEAAKDAPLWCFNALRGIWPARLRCP